MATTTVKIDVTQSDIDAGERGDCGNCPIALATLRAFPGATYVSVEDNRIEVTTAEGNGLCAETPDNACTFICDFDNGWTDDVKPFSFDAEFAPPVDEDDDDDCWDD